MWAAVLITAQLPLSMQPLLAQETNTFELIRQLQRRIEELEQKVRVLQQGQAAPAGTNGAAAGRSLEALDQKVRILERERELEAEAAESKTRELPRITIGEQGFRFTSAETNFSLQLKGVLQVDSRTFFNDSGIVGNDGLLLRRARPILQGTVFREFDFLFVPDFGGSGSPQIFDAYVNYRYRPALQLQAGKFKTPVGLEQLQADKDTLFNERALPTDLVPNRDLGIELHGDLWEGALSYAAGVFNGVGDARNSSNVDFEDNKAFAGRIFAQPFKKISAKALRGFGFGLAGSYEDMQGTNTAGLPATTGGSLPGYATPAQEQFFAYRSATAAAGNHWRLSPQACYFYGPFGLLAEYVISDQKVSALETNSAHLQHTAWQVAASWVLTGEDASFTGVVPRHAFNPWHGNWGALQLVARYSELKLDRAVFPIFADPSASARTAQEWAVGLNWYLNRNIRVNADFSHVNFVGGGGSGSSAPAAVTRKDENVLFTRVQLAF